MMTIATKHPMRLYSTDVFSYKDLLRMFLPVLVEQTLLCLLAVADTLMASYLSDEATAGVSYVITITNWVDAFFSSLAIGSSVLASQYIGQKRSDYAATAMRMSLLTSSVLSGLFCSVLVIDRAGALQLLLGKIESGALEHAVTYFTFMIPAYFFRAVSYVCTASLRVQGDTKRPMILSVGAMIVGLGLKLVFSYGYDLGVAGFSLATMVSSILTAVVGILLMEWGKGRIRVLTHRAGAKFFDGSMAWHGFAVGIPVALDSSLFHLGVIILARLLVTYGVIHGAATGIASQLHPLSYIASTCWDKVGIVAVSRAIGAGDKDQAKRYVRVILALCYGMLTVSNILCLIFADRLVLLFGGSDEVHHLAAVMFRIYCWFSLGVYTLSFTLPQMINGAGDGKMVMWISVVCMFVVRIGSGYLLGTVCGLGGVGLYLAMGLNWTARAGCFVYRYFSGKWLDKKVV